MIQPHVKKCMTVSSKSRRFDQFLKELSSRPNILLTIYLSTPPVTKERFCMLGNGSSPVDLILNLFCVVAYSSASLSF